MAGLNYGPRETTYYLQNRGKTFILSLNEFLVAAAFQPIFLPRQIQHRLDTYNNKIITGIGIERVMWVTTNL